MTLGEVILPPDFPTALPVMPPAKKDEPAWPIAFLFPTQGNWSEADYLALNTNRLVELSNGFLEVLPMPTVAHQLIVAHAHEKLKAHVGPKSNGWVLFAPMPVRLWPGMFREPDVVFLKPHRIVDVHKQPDGADLAMEVLSPGEENRKRDLELKRQEYAQAGISEYWIIDPEKREILVLTLDGTTYREHGVFQSGSRATSLLLPGFELDVDEVFRAGGE